MGLRKPGNAAAGGLIRDAFGGWIRGLGHNLGTATVLAAELWAMLHGLKLAWDLGYNSVILEACQFYLKKTLADPSRPCI